MWTSYEVNEDAMSGHSVLAGHSRRPGSYYDVQTSVNQWLENCRRPIATCKDVAAHGDRAMIEGDSR